MLRWYSRACFALALFFVSTFSARGDILPVDWYYAAGYGQTGTDTYTISVILQQGSSPDGPYQFCVVGGGCATQTCTGGTCTGSGSVILSGSAPTHAGTGGPSDTTFNGADYTWGGVAGTWSMTVRGVPNECFSDCLLYVGHNNNADVTMSLPGATPTPGPTATPDARCGWSVDLSLVPRCPAGVVGQSTVAIKVDGTYRYGPFSIPVGSGTITGYYDGVDSEGTVVTVEMDGEPIKSNTVRCSGDPPPSNHWLVTATTGQVCNAPTPAPTASPSGTAYPTPTPPPGTPPPSSTPPMPTAPPHVTPGPPTGSPSSSVAVTNYNDFYEPVRQAVRDSGNGIGVPTQSKAGVEDVALEDGDMPEITDAMGEIKSNVETLASDLQTTKTAMDTAINAIHPGDIGSESVITMNMPSYFASLIGVSTMTIDLADYGSGISLLRLLTFWTITVAFLFLTIKALVYNG